MNVIFDPHTRKHSLSICNVSISVPSAVRFSKDFHHCSLLMVPADHFPSKRDCLDRLALSSSAPESIPTSVLTHAINASADAEVSASSSGIRALTPVSAPSPATNAIIDALNAAISPLTSVPSIPMSVHMHATTAIFDARNTALSLDTGVLILAESGSAFDFSALIFNSSHFLTAPPNDVLFICACGTSNPSVMQPKETCVVDQSFGGKEFGARFYYRHASRSEMSNVSIYEHAIVILGNIRRDGTGRNTGTCSIRVQNKSKKIKYNFN